MDDYDREPGLRDLINNLRKVDEESMNDTTLKSIEEIEYKTDVLRRFNDANSACIDELRRAEEAIQCRKAWERHAIGLMVASAEPVPLITHDPSDKIARIASDIYQEQHPLLTRVGD